MFPQRSCKPLKLFSRNIAYTVSDFSDTGNLQFLALRDRLDVGDRLQQWLVGTVI